MAQNLTPSPLADAFQSILHQRFSCRGFLRTQVPRDTIERILSLAQRTPSWCNSQPWQVTITEPAATERVRAALQAADPLPAGQWDIAPPAEYRGVYRERRRTCGFQLYDSVGIAHGDRQASARQADENFRLFGAPHVAIVTTEAPLGTYGVLDCGAYVNNFMLAAASLGVACIAQAALASKAHVLRECLGLPKDRLVVCGISFGFADAAHPANGFRTERAAQTEVVTWVAR